MVCVDQDHPVPECTDDVSALVFMGAAVSVNDPLPWVEGELRLIRRALREGVPVLGVCFGAQLMSKALGGAVSRGEEMEINPLMVTPHGAIAADALIRLREG